ncbi:hypothetical protein SAMN05216251_13716 [Actinacidiphila alni]|uniref:SH3 domain-containing protein n=1 Tax=Actinacidiphila alni TaxID=380248 RepID=A0A1I2MJ95_9ACTN|nr:hypothetical protein SAMN05216251_13716 [Actinacidiphila alni]
MIKAIKMGLFSAVLTGSMLGIAQAPATATTATPLACTHPSWYNADGSKAYGNQDVIPIHDGPSADCTVIFRTAGPKEFTLHCYVLNDVGHSWTHVAVNTAATTVLGWVYDPYLDGGGSFEPCGGAR